MSWFQAPAAFGLATFLLHEGFDRARIRRHLALFSFAAPILAMITYFGLSGVCKTTLVSTRVLADTMFYLDHVIIKVFNNNNSTSQCFLRFSSYRKVECHTDKTFSPFTFVSQKILHINLVRAEQDVILATCGRS